MNNELKSAIFTEEDQDSLEDLSEERLQQDLQNILTALKKSEAENEISCAETEEHIKPKADPPNSSGFSEELNQKKRSIIHPRELPMKRTKKFLHYENKLLRLRLKELDRQTSDMLQKLKISEAPSSKPKKSINDSQSVDRISNNNSEFNAQKRLKIYKKEHSKLKLRHAQVNDPNYESLLRTEITQKEAFLSKFEKLLKGLGRDQDSRIKAMELLDFDNYGLSIVHLYEEFSKISYRSKQLEKLIERETEQYNNNKKKETELVQKLSLGFSNEGPGFSQNLQYKYDFLKQYLSFTEKNKAAELKQLKMQELSMRRSNELLLNELADYEDKVKGKNSLLKNIGGQLEQTIQLSNSVIGSYLRKNNSRSSSLTKALNRSSKREDSDFSANKNLNRSLVYEPKDLAVSKSEPQIKPGKPSNAGVSDIGIQKLLKITEKKKVVKTEQVSRSLAKLEVEETKHNNPVFQNKGRSVFKDPLREEAISPGKKGIKYERKNEIDKEGISLVNENRGFRKPPVHDKLKESPGKEKKINSSEIKNELKDERITKVAQIETGDFKLKTDTKDRELKGEGNSPPKTEFSLKKIISKFSEKPEVEETKKMNSDAQSKKNTSPDKDFPKKPFSLFSKKLINTENAKTEGLKNKEKSSPIKDLKTFEKELPKTDLPEKKTTKKVSPKTQSLDPRPEDPISVGSGAKNEIPNAARTENQQIAKKEDLKSKIPDSKTSQKPELTKETKNAEEPKIEPSDPLFLDIEQILKSLPNIDHLYETPDQWLDYADDVFDLIRINNSSLHEEYKSSKKSLSQKTSKNPNN